MDRPFLPIPVTLTRKASYQWTAKWSRLGNTEKHNLVAKVASLLQFVSPRARVR